MKSIHWYVFAITVTVGTALAILLYVWSVGIGERGEWTRDAKVRATLAMAEPFSKEFDANVYFSLTKQREAHGPNVKMRMITEWWNAGDKARFIEYARQRLTRNEHDIAGLWMMRHYAIAVRDMDALLDVCYRLAEALEGISTKYLLEIRPRIGRDIEVDMQMYCIEPVRTQILAEMNKLSQQEWDAAFLLGASGKCVGKQFGFQVMCGDERYRVIRAVVGFESSVAG